MAPMQNLSRPVSAVAALIAATLSVAAFGCGDDDSTATTSTTAAPQTTTTETTSTRDTVAETTTERPDVPTIVIKDGEPVGGVEELSFAEGDQIRFKVDSDVAEEVHFHGYDVSMDVKAGGSVEFDVPATITGVFEVELEQSVTQIAEITVNPG
jgi:hypothetical protein